MSFRIVIGICLLVFLSMQEILCANSDTSSLKRRQHTFKEENNYKESIYVTLDKTFYLSGEYLRFKVYCLEADSKLPSLLSKIAYLELLDSSNNSIIRTKIRLNHGIGYGDIFIPSNFNSGNYILRSYTNWMKNSRAEEFFHTIIQVINPFRKAGLSPKPKSKGISLKLTPEGDNLIYGLRSKIAFQATNTSGKGVAFAGNIINESDSSLLEFSSQKSGLGSFYLEPEQNKSYRAKVMLPDSSEYVFELPEIKTNGYVMHVEILNDKNISIDIRSLDQSTIETLFIEGHVNNRIQFKRNISIQKGFGNIRKSLDNVDQGILHINLKNSEGEILNQRMIIVYPEEEINLYIQTNKDTYKKREKIIVKVNSSDLEGMPVNMNLSISASIHKTDLDKYGTDIESYIFLNNVMRTIPDSYSVLKDCKTDMCKIMMDNLLLANSDMAAYKVDLQYDTDSIRFVPEFRNHIITGRLTNNLTNLPEEGVMAYLSFTSKNADFLATQSGQNGILMFEMSDFSDMNKIVAQTDYTVNTKYRIEIDDPYSKKFARINIPRFDLDEGLRNFIEKISENMQVRNAYLKYTPIMEVLNTSDSSTFYEPDAVYFLDDYTRFPVMEEVMREYVGGVYVRRNQEGFHFKILDLDRTETFQENPLILIDGVPVFDADEIMDLDPLYVKKIETVRKRFIKDGYKYSGIVSFFTYSGDLNGFQLQDNAEVIEYGGIQAMREYKHPVYINTSDKNSRLPDYRNVLYWNPQFNTNDQGEATLEFYTSDASGEYEIRIEGISNDGRTAFRRLLIQVTDDP